MLERVVADCRRRRVPIPPPYDDPPSIGREFALVVWAFNELSRERDPPSGEGKNFRLKRITHRAIREWAEFRGFSTDADIMDELHTLVPALDTVWIEAETKTIKQKIGGNNGKPA